MHTSLLCNMHKREGQEKQMKHCKLKWFMKTVASFSSKDEPHAEENFHFQIYIWMCITHCMAILI